MREGMGNAVCGAGVRPLNQGHGMPCPYQARFSVAPHRTRCNLTAMCFLPGSATCTVPKSSSE